MTVSLIAAMDRDGLIGSGGTLPWHLPGDLRRFRALTWGRPIVMGRKTWSSIGRPLPGRLNIVLSGDPGFRAEGGRVARSLAEAVEIAGRSHPGDADGELFVIGGASVFAEAIPIAGRFYRTTVEGDFSGDVRFPTELIEGSDWIVVSSEDFDATGPDLHPCRLDVLERVPIGEGGSTRG